MKDTEIFIDFITEATNIMRQNCLILILILLFLNLEPKKSVIDNYMYMSVGLPVASLRLNG